MEIYFRASSSFGFVPKSVVQKYQCTSHLEQDYELINAVDNYCYHYSQTPSVFAIFVCSCISLKEDQYVGKQLRFMERKLEEIKQNTGRIRSAFQTDIKRNAELAGNKHETREKRGKGNVKFPHLERRLVQIKTLVFRCFNLSCIFFSKGFYSLLVLFVIIALSLSVCFCVCLRVYGVRFTQTQNPTP